MKSGEEPGAFGAVRTFPECERSLLGPRLLRRTELGAPK
jgi:hypothetical protein